MNGWDHVSLKVKKMIEMDLKKRFEKAIKRVWRLKEKPDEMTLLKLYALYKQATEGDVKSPRPISRGMAGLAKWRAWRKLRGIAIEEGHGTLLYSRRHTNEIGKGISLELIDSSVL